MLTEAQIRKMPKKAYMNEQQLEFFRDRLLEARAEVLARQSEVRGQLDDSDRHADPVDRASAEEERALALRLRERENQLLGRIDRALRRIREGEYGYCEATGEEIGIPRLLARPTASECVDARESTERRRSVYGSRRAA